MRRPALFLAALLAAARPATAGPDDRPDVLFIAIDDLNDWVGCLGGHPQVEDAEHRPAGAARDPLHQRPLPGAALQPVADERPDRPPAVDDRRSTAWPPGSARSTSSPTSSPCPQHFRENGYTTLSAGKVYHGGYPPGPDRPREFDVYGPGPSVGPKPDQKLIGETPGGNHPLMDWGTFPHRDEDKGDYQVASWAVEQIEMPPEGPSFLAAGFILPHVPLLRDAGMVRPVPG